MTAASTQDDNDAIAEAVDNQQLAARERKLAQHRTLLEQGTDPAIVTEWIRAVEAERARLQTAARTVHANAVNTAVMATDGTPWDPSVDERLCNYGVRGGT